MTEVRDDSIIVCCRGDEDDEGSGHPLIYLYKEEETFCPYCNELMSEEPKSEESESKELKKSKEFKSVVVAAAANERKRTPNGSF